MENAIHALIPFYRAARESGQPLALATLIETAGSTYRKAGTQMLIRADGQYAGLLSGGCLEGDLAKRARQVMSTQRAQRVSYDMRGPDDRLWGLGSGCEGAMQILLGYCGPGNDYAPMPWLESCMHGDEPLRFALIVQGSDERLGTCLRAAPPQSDEQLLWIELQAPPSLWLCGGGPDALPVARLAQLLGWRTSVLDHRPAYADATRFPPGTTVHQIRPAPIDNLTSLPRPDAVVVMSHHLDTDRGWLAALAQDPPGYVGLLGPAPRREKLLAELTAAQREALRAVLRAPVGLDLGGRTPESIALSIVAEIQAVLHGRSGQAFSAAVAR